MFYGNKSMLFPKLKCFGNNYDLLIELVKADSFERNRKDAVINEILIRADVEVTKHLTIDMLIDARLGKSAVSYMKRFLEVGDPSKVYHDGDTLPDEGLQERPGRRDGIFGRGESLERLPAEPHQWPWGNRVHVGLKDASRHGKGVPFRL